MTDLIDATPEDRKAFDQAVKYLSRDPEARKLLAELEARHTSVTIVHNADNRFVEETNTIQWDPQSGLVVRDAKGVATGVQSPAMALIHETAHATDRHLDKRLSATRNDDYDNDAEFHAVQEEDKAAKTLGEPLRFNHRGDSIRDYNPTEHSTTKPDGKSVWMTGDGVERGPYIQGSMPPPIPQDMSKWRSLESGSDSPAGQMGQEMDSARDFVRQLQQSNSGNAATESLSLMRQAYDRGRD